MGGGVPAERTPKRLKRCRTVQAVVWGELGGGERCGFWGDYRGPGVHTDFVLKG